MRQQLGLPGGQGRRSGPQGSGTEKSEVVGGSRPFSRRPGHYNPYTHQYVPAPSSTSDSGNRNGATRGSRTGPQRAQEMSLNGQGNQQRPAAGIGVHGSSSTDRDALYFSLNSDSSHPTHHGSLADDDEAMNIIGDDWLEDYDDDDEGEEEEERGDSVWAMELNESELASLDSISNDASTALDMDVSEDGFGVAGPIGREKLTKGNL